MSQERIQSGQIQFGSLLCREERGQVDRTEPEDGMT